MKGEAVLIKTDDLGQPVAGAEYNLMYKASGSKDYAVIDNIYTTNAEGEIAVGDLAWGDYYFIERKAPTGYLLSEERIPFTLNQDSVQSTIYLTAFNLRQKGSLKLTKVDAENKTAALSGAEYELYRTDGTKCALGIDYTLPDGGDKIITGADGTVTIADIPQGGYYLLESVAPEAYSLSDEKIRFSVTKENAAIQQEITAEDARNQACLKINKSINEGYDPFGNPTFIFRIYKKDPDTLEILQTYYKTITLSSDCLSGNVSIIVDQGYYYDITEVNAGRYKLEEMTANTGNVNIGSKNVTADLLTSDYAEVTFANCITQYEKLSHTTNAANIIKAGAKLTGISVEYQGPQPICETADGYDAENRTYTIRPSDLSVKSLYDDGTSCEIPTGAYTLNNPVVDGSSNSYTGTVIYKEDGVERKGTFSVDVLLPEPWKYYWVVIELGGGTIVKDGDATMTAVESWVRQIKEGNMISQPENEPQKPGYRFKGWFADPEYQIEYDFTSSIKQNTQIYAKWEENYDVKYAVAIYEINNIDADGTQLPLTFGPASGKDYANTFNRHVPAEGELCIHDMTWEEIITQARKDPNVFLSCLENSCTHSVLINMTDPSGSSKPIKATSYNGMMDDGDGATNLMHSINPSYRKWNREHSIAYKESSSQYQYGTNEGGWPDSAIRNMLNGTVTEGMLTMSNAGNGFEEEKLDETTALLSCFPQVLQDAIYPRAVKSDTVYNKKTEENNVITHDKLWLLSSSEYFSMYLSESSQHPLEGTVFRRQRLNHVNVAWTQAKLYTETGEETVSWFRSVYERNNHVAASTNKGYHYYANSCSLAGIAPAFSIK